MVKEFEATAFSLQTNQISDIVTTQFGYHIIKLSEKMPAKKIEFAKVAPDIRQPISAIGFGKVNVCSTSHQTTTLYNDGTGALTLNSITRASGRTATPRSFRWSWQSWGRP